jgi:rare lipoprotein A
MPVYIAFYLLLMSVSSCSFVDKKLSYWGIGNCVNQYSKDSYKGHAKVGKSYTIKGTEYTPEVDHNYSEEGTASWYGDDFHCKKTANGEAFNKWEMSAAHRTLPLPSIVRVTNLSNNKSIKVTINDRGPFTSDSKRIIDLSEAAATKLGFKHKGVERVRVDYLYAESQKLIARLDLPEHVYFKNNKLQMRDKISIETDDMSLGQFMEAASNGEDRRLGKLYIGQFNNKTDLKSAVNKLRKFGHVDYVESISSSQKKNYKIYLSGFSGDKKILLTKIKKTLSNKNMVQ